MSWPRASTSRRSAGVRSPGYWRALLPSWKRKRTPRLPGRLPWRGPKATVRLLSWLPVFGLLLGMALGVDPVGILLGNVMGTATFVSGLVLTTAGRLWSARLVAAAGAD